MQSDHATNPVRWTRGLAVVPEPRPVGTIPTAAETPCVSQLRTDAIGLPQVLFQWIASMAPASAVALTLGAAVPFAGGSLPLAVLIALIVGTLVALNIAQLGVRLPSAGGLYTCISCGLGA